MEECSICLLPLTNKKTITTFCNHTFHIDCLNDCLERKLECPLCRNNYVVKFEYNILINNTSKKFVYKSFNNVIETTSLFNIIKIKFPKYNTIDDFEIGQIKNGSVDIPIIENKIKNNIRGINILIHSDKLRLIRNAKYDFFDKKGQITHREYTETRLLKFSNSYELSKNVIINLPLKNTRNIINNTYNKLVQKINKLNKYAEKCKETIINEYGKNINGWIIFETSHCEYVLVEFEKPICLGMYSNNGWTDGMWHYCFDSNGNIIMINVKYDKLVKQLNETNFIKIINDIDKFKKNKSEMEILHNNWSAYVNISFKNSGRLLNKDNKEYDIEKDEEIKQYKNDYDEYTKLSRENEKLGMFIYPNLIVNRTDNIFTINFK